jgi:hypothetical protein
MLLQPLYSGGVGVAELGGRVKILAFFLVIFPGIAAAEFHYPVSIPGECVELAQREGQPLIIESKMQELKAGPSEFK